MHEFVGKEKVTIVHHVVLCFYKSFPREYKYLNYNFRFFHHLTSQSTAIVLPHQPVYLYILITLSERYLDVVSHFI